MKIKIISDGTSAGTKVVDCVSGEPIAGVTMINYMASTDGEPEALMHLVGIQCEIVCDARATLTPDLNPYEAEDIFDDEDPSN